MTTFFSLPLLPSAPPARSTYQSINISHFVERSKNGPGLQPTNRFTSDTTFFFPWNFYCFNPELSRTYKRSLKKVLLKKYLRKTAELSSYIKIRDVNSSFYNGNATGCLQYTRTTTHRKLTHLTAVICSLTCKTPPSLPPTPPRHPLKR